MTLRLHQLALLSTLLLCTACGTQTPEAAQEQQGHAIIRGESPTSQSATDPGPFEVLIIDQSDGLRDGPDYLSATIYFPGDAQPPLASIVIVPGYASPESSIQAWGPFYASHGIVTMTVGTNSPVSDYPPERAQALLDAITTLRAEQDRTDSPLKGRLALDRIAVSGWSMGGGGSQVAATLEPSLRAVVALCPWKPNPDFDHAVPLLILGAENDSLAPFNEHGLLHYQATPETTPKLMFEVAGAGHWAANGPKGTQDDVGDGSVGRIALSWLKVFLEGDERYRPFLLETPSAASRFESNLEELD